MENDDEHVKFVHDCHCHPQKQDINLLATFFVLYTHSKLQSQWKANNDNLYV